jgi:hypothetical protein
MESRSILSRNHKIFEQYCEKIISLKSLPDEVLIDAVSSLSSFAFRCHSGFFYSPLLENKLALIGKRNQKDLENFDTKISNYKFIFPSNNKRNIVHIATTLYAVGGHSSYFRNLVEFDAESNHYLILTQQECFNLPASVENEFNSEKGNLIKFGNESPIEKAGIIKSVLHEQNVYIFLHTHPYDCVPVLAFSNKKKAPVILINHADHAFWLGSSIADIVINIREEAAEICKKKRNLTHNIVLPIPIKSDGPAVTRVEAKQKLGIDPNKILAISMGSFYKFVPNETYDFFSTIEEIMNKNPDLLVKIIGVSENEDLQKLNFNFHNQIELLGIIENTNHYKQAADIIIDPMPYGSYTSVLEFCAFGSYPIITYNPNKLFDLSQDPALNGLIQVASNRAEYIDSFNKIISDNDRRNKIAEIIKFNMAKYHSGPNWLEKYHSIFKHKSDTQQFCEFASDVVDENGNYFAKLSEPNIGKEYELLLNSIYRNAACFNVFDIIGMVGLIKNLSLGKSLLYRIVFLLSLFKNRLKELF